VTATSVNTLVNTWTEKGKFIDSTPENVKSAVKLGALWVYKYAMSDVYESFNCIGGYSGLLVRFSFTYYNAHIYNYSLEIMLGIFHAISMNG